MATRPSSTVAGKSAEELGQNGFLGDQRIAEITLKQPPQKMEILLPDRLAEAELFGKLCMPLGRNAALTRHQQHGIARQDTNEGKGNDGNPEKCRNEIEKFAENEPDHGFPEKTRERT